MTDRNAPGRGEAALSGGFGGARSRALLVFLLTALAAIAVVFWLRN